MPIGDGVDFSTTLINKTTISKSKFRVFGNPYEFALAKPTVEGLTPLAKQCVWLPRIGFWIIWFSNMTSSGNFGFWIVNCAYFPTELWLITSIFGVSGYQRGGLQFFRKIENLFFSLKSLEKKCHVGGTEIHHIDTPLAKRTLNNICMFFDVILVPGRGDMGPGKGGYG